MGGWCIEKTAGVAGLAELAELVRRRLMHLCDPTLDLAEIREV